MANEVIIKQTEAYWSKWLGLNNSYGEIDDRRVDFGKTSTVKGAFVKFVPEIAPDGRWATGMDELSVGLNRITDAKLREAEKKKRKEKRERLESILGKDLSGTSSFWETVIFDVVTREGDLILNIDNPQDEIKLSLLLASGKVAPSEDDLHRSEYRDARFYVYDARAEKSKTKTNKLKRKELQSILYNYKSDKDRLYYLCRYFSILVSPDMEADEMFLMLDEHISNYSSANLDIAKAKLTASPAELITNVIVTEAIRKEVFSFHKQHQSFYFQEKPIGTNAEQIIKFFSKSENLDLRNNLESIINNLDR